MNHSQFMLRKSFVGGLVSKTRLYSPAALSGFRF